MQKRVKFTLLADVKNDTSIKDSRAAHQQQGFQPGDCCNERSRHLHGLTGQLPGRADNDSPHLEHKILGTVKSSTAVQPQ
jgi:hypothetical protein